MFVYYSPGDRAQQVIPGGAKTNESFWKSQNNVEKTHFRFPSILRFPFRFLFKSSSAGPVPTTVRVLCWDSFFFQPAWRKCHMYMCVFSFFRAARGNTHILLQFFLIFGIFARHRVSPVGHPNNPDHTNISKNIEQEQSHRGAPNLYPSVDLL